MMKDYEKKPWWWPVLCDDEYFVGLRSDYEEAKDMSDDELQETYADGQKYATLWDHVGDAKEDYEPLADAFFELIEEYNKLSDKKWPNF